MELTPQTLHAVEFREARRGGYNTRDVDDFLERVAEGVALLHDRMRDAMARAEGAESRLADMQRQLGEVQRRPAAPEVSETDDTLRRTLVLAQRTADATIKEAKDEAARLLSEAREEAARVRSEIEAEARRGTEGARLAAEAEVEHLIDAREALRGDLDALSQQIDKQREQIRSGIAELERVLDDPETFKPVGVPPLTEIERPERPALTPRPEPSMASTPAGPPAPPGPPSPSRPALPARNVPAAEPEPTNGNGPDLGSPFQLGAQVAALQEAPPLPSRPKPEPAPAPAAQQAAPFPSFSGSGGPEPAAGPSPVPAPGANTPWPSQLRTSVAADEVEPNGPPAPPGPPSPPVNGAVEGIGIEPGSRPSEWGKRVFDQADDTDPHARFGHR
jgi:DivIVA domain-containing protein